MSEALVGDEKALLSEIQDPNLLITHYIYRPLYSFTILYPQLSIITCHYIIYGYNFHTTPLQDLEKELQEIEAVTEVTGKVAGVSMAFPAIASVHAMYPFVGWL